MRKLLADFLFGGDGKYLLGLSKAVAVLSTALSVFVICL